MHKTLFIFLIFQASFTLAQNKTGDFEKLANAQSIREELGSMTSGGLSNAYINSNKYLGVQGHPFLYSNWSVGKLGMNDKNIVSADKFKYKFEIYTNEIWLLFGRDSIILNSNEVSWFEIDNNYEKLLFEKCQLCNIKKPHNFYQKIFEDTNYKVYRQISKKLVKANYIEKGMYSSGSKFDSFEEDNKIIYLVWKDSKVSKVKNNLKEISEKLDPSELRIATSFAKKHKLNKNLKNNELFELFNHLNKQRN